MSLDDLRAVPEKGKTGDLRALDVTLLAFAVAIGLLAGVGALAFRSLIELFHFLFWASGGSFAEQVAATPWWLRLCIPTLGGLVAGPVITFWAPEARGPGVPEVIVSVTSGQSTIRHRVTFLKGFVTSLLLGTGASVGREGPIVQIGASVGSSLAQLFKIRPELRRLCLACGAAAGISATFNAPIAGSIFAMEIILMNIEVSFISHIVVASITGSVLSRIFWGEFPVFQAVPFVLESYWELLLYLGLGLAAGLVSIVFVRLIYGLDTGFQGIKLPEWCKPAIGGLALGSMALALPQVLGVGYDTVNAALTGSLSLSLALILLAGKILATSLCIGSGMSGGIFAPSLFVGAVLGTAVGLGAMQVWPGDTLHPSFFALAGMGAVVSGTTLAPITAIMTIFELTLQYQIILPLMLACISSTLVVRFLFGFSAYEMKLLRRGVNIVRGHDVGVLRSLLVRDFMRRDFVSVPEDLPLKDLYAKLLEASYPHFVVLNASGQLSGVVSFRDLRRVLPNLEELESSMTTADIMTSQVVTLWAQDNLERALHLFEEQRISFVPVLASGEQGTVAGIMTKDDLLSAYDQKVLKDRVLSGRP